MNTIQIESRIKERFVDGDAVVFDLTGAGNHFEVRVASSEFNGMTRIQQHQAVMGLFKAELDSGEIHALGIKTITK
ncbi:MAG: BolA/IbaG family iron-sulfur metabolism protein [Bdellovibrionales bacterium]|nr:BolA/IbaG family iron-sulfur metabolism protein [Bdellovibrionales bacterium]